MSNENGKRTIRVKDVYTKVAVIEERLNNLIRDNREEHGDISTRLTNLEDKFQRLKDNELKHLRREGMSWKQQTAYITVIIALVEVIKKLAGL